jgi:hypothetical protein
VQEVSGIRELVGSDVNMIHRLMKNHVTENTGWNAYVLFTHRAFQNLGVYIEGIHDQTESYEHLGEIQIHCLDLHARYKAIIEARHIFISLEDADFAFSYDFNAPPPIIWHWLTDIEKKTLLADGGAVFSAQSRPGGRTGPGASNHCAHGKNLKGSLVEIILDWRPFDYYTLEAVEGKSNMRQTYKLEPNPDGTKTRLHILTMMISPPIPRFIRRLVLKMMFSKMQLSYCQAMAKYIAQDVDAEIGSHATQAAA